MKEISYQGLWSVSLTDEQYAVGKEVALRNASHFALFIALKDAGVPVRADGKYPASQAATAFRDNFIRGKLA